MSFKILLSVMAVLFVFLLMSGTAFAYVNTDIVPVNNLEDLMNISKTPENLSRNYILMSDIDIGSEETNDLKFAPIGTDAAPFKGRFNGNNHTISNITISNESMNYVGLFGYTKNCSISYLSLENIDIAGGQYVGALVGFAFDTSIKNCSVSNSENFKICGSSFVDDLVGFMSSSLASDSYAAGTVEDQSDVSNLVGIISGSISDIMRPVMLRVTTLEQAVLSNL